MRYFLLVGEASGDGHAGRLIRAIREEDPRAEFAGMGGPSMADAGCHLYRDYRDMAFMGLIAVLKNLSKVRQNFQIAKSAIREWRPDVVIAIDYPSFNLRVLEWVKKTCPQIRTTYYIPPKVWAWKKWRVHRIARYADHILGIFPFEPAFYARYGYQATYVGNPTMEAISQWCNEHEPCKQSAAERKVIAILPGSRKHEIDMCLGKMLDAALRVAERHDARLVISRAPGIDRDYYQPYLQDARVSLTDDAYSLVHMAEAAVVNSGTATLETALLDCPQVAVYHIAGGWVTMHLLRPLFFRIARFTLVNIIAGENAICELIGDRFTTQEVSKELERLISDDAHRKYIRNAYARVRQTLGQSEAATCAAKIICKKG